MPCCALCSILRWVSVLLLLFCQFLYVFYVLINGYSLCLSLFSIFPLCFCFLFCFVLFFSFLFVQFFKIMLSIVCSICVVDMACLCSPFLFRTLNRISHRWWEFKYETIRCDRQRKGESERGDSAKFKSKYRRIVCHYDYSIVLCMPYFNWGAIERAQMLIGIWLVFMIVKTKWNTVYFGILRLCQTTDQTHRFDMCDRSTVSDTNNKFLATLYGLLSLNVCMPTHMLMPTAALSQIVCDSPKF